MPRDLRSERPYSLAEFCCNGDCRQGRDCPLVPRRMVDEGEWEPVPDAEVIWLLMPFIVGVIGGLAILVMVLT